MYRELFHGVGLYGTELVADDLAPPSARHTKTSFISTAIVSFDSRSYYEAGDNVCFQDFSNFLKTRRRHSPESTIAYGTTICLISRHFVLRIRGTKTNVLITME